MTATTKRNASPLLAIGLILTIGILALPMLLSKRSSETPAEIQIQDGEQASDQPLVVEEPIAEGEKVKRFTVVGHDFSFSPTQLTANEGDTVVITFKNTQGIHDLIVEGYNIGTKQIRAGQEETIQFIASQKGTFEYYCSVSTHRQMGMVGTLTIL